MEPRPGRIDTIAIRSRLILEAASEMAAFDGWPHRQAQVSFRDQGRGGWLATWIASDSPEAIDLVASGEAQVAIINPAAPLTLAVRGTGPFRAPIPLRIIAVMPSRDQMGFAVAPHTGLTTFEEIRVQRPPLRVSLRRPQHSATLVVREVARAAGFTFEDLEAWGGQVRYDGGLPDMPQRWGAFERGEVDAIFDEAMNRWANLALGAGMRFLSMGDSLLARLEEVGLRRSAISRKEHPLLAEDVPTVDFSGWAVFTHASAPDDWITAFCAAIDARRDRIPWQGEGPLPLERMCRDSPDGPIDIPLHPAAERYWRSRGYLS